METHPLENIIESIIFVSDQPVKAEALLDTLNGQNLPNTQGTSKKEDTKEEKEEPEEAEEVYTLEQVQAGLAGLLDKYQDERYPFEVRKVAKGFQFFTKKDYYPYVRKATVLRHQKRLTRAAMETLAIVAYRQPVTKAEVEFIRGVNCDYAIQKLLEKKLVAIIGRADAVGKPLLYATSEHFMQYFGINGVEDLPKLKEFEELMEDNLELFQQQQAEKAANEAQAESTSPDDAQTEEAVEKGETAEEADASGEKDTTEVPEVEASEEIVDQSSEAKEENDGEEKENH